jgi:UDP-N-acetyl-D-glucosamine dehydrogenase
VKLLENTFRAVNIGLVNELALMCDRMNIDVWEVVDAARTKPFGFMAFYPGPGLGGHCIPIDPFYLSWKAKQTGFDPRFIELAGHINSSMPHYVVDKVGEALNTRRKPINGSRILVAGVAYKRDIDDMRESPALDVMGLLHERGAQVDYADPFVAQVHGREWSGGYDIKSVALARGGFGQYDCVVIVTDHKAFDYAAMVQEADIIVDTRNAIKERHAHIFRLGAPRISSVEGQKAAIV